MPARPRVLFAQYLNPGMYPPTQNAAWILAEAGWDVLILGISAPGQAGTLNVPPHPRIRSLGWRYSAPGWRQKLHFLAFCVWSVTWAFRFRPHWCYLSDPISTLLAWLLIKCQFRVVYHEHDGPTIGQIEKNPVWLKKRIAVARQADLCVLPAAGRVTRFKETTGRTKPTFCANNCPLRADVRPPRTGAIPERVQLLYSGSIGPDRIPEAIIHALANLPASVTFRAVGYEIRERETYIPHLKRLATELGVADRVEFLQGRSRHHLWDLLAESDVGLSLRPMTTSDPNFQHMVGATNKAFDYFAVGMPLLVSDLPEWRTGYVEPGLALSCLPDDPISIANALRWFAEHPTEMRAMGERGRRRVETDWNYETQFAPVLQAMTEALTDTCRRTVSDCDPAADRTESPASGLSLTTSFSRPA